MRFRTTNPAHGSTQLPADPAGESLEALTALTYELLDAHADTARLATDEATREEWQNHLAYLRDLQRVGREALARAADPRP
jgi:ABC-type uncharacterized transport system YnjBCD substrate-binding protein